MGWDRIERSMYEKIDIEIPKEIKNPRLELAKIVEKVKRTLKKIKRKNPGRAKTVSGSTK